MQIRPARHARALRLATAGLAAALAIAHTACRDDANPATAQLAIVAVSFDAADAPRHGPLIAGEPARVAIRFAGGQPPYTGTVVAVREPGSGADGDRGGDENRGGPVALRAEFAPDPNQTRTGDVEIAMRADLDRDALSGDYRVRVDLRDGAGRTATATSAVWTLIGADAHTRPPPGSPPYADVHDVAGRRRSGFVRGESVTIRARIPGADREIAFTLLDPHGRVLARSRRRAASGQSALTLPIPRLATPGTYTIAVADVHAEDGTPAAVGAIPVVGEPFPPVHQLVVDQLHLYGGQDQQTPRSGYLYRGETVRVEARTGGGQREVTGVLRIRNQAGRMVLQAAIGRARIAHPAPDTRTFVAGDWHIPKQLPPGRYQLQIEVSEEDHVSTRNREVFIE